MSAKRIAVLVIVPIAVFAVSVGLFLLLAHPGPAGAAEPPSYTLGEDSGKLALFKTGENTPVTRYEIYTGFCPSRTSPPCSRASLSPRRKSCAAIWRISARNGPRRMHAGSFPGGHDLQPVAVRVRDEIDAHGLVFKADTAHLLVQSVSGRIIVHGERQMELVFTQVVGFGAVRQPCQLQLWGVTPSPR